MLQQLQPTGERGNRTSLKSTERVQNQAPNREEALIRVIMSLASLQGLTNLREHMGFVDDIDTADRDLFLLASLPTILGCEHEASTHEASQFKVLQELIDRRTADFERMKAEGAVPKSEAEKKGTESGDDEEVEKA